MRGFDTLQLIGVWGSGRLSQHPKTKKRLQLTLKAF